GSKFYVFGGRTGGNVVGDGFDTVQVYDPLTDTWDSSSDPGSTLAPMPEARGGTGKAVFLNGEFYVFGGETLTSAAANASGVYDRVDIYNPVTNTWRLGTPMPTARHGIFPVEHAGVIYVAAGGVQAGGSASNLLEAYYVDVI
ncbi:MAG: kelch repeat-containing protein, partial [Verrucomicrobiota bacterium]